MLRAMRARRPLRLALAAILALAAGAGCRSAAAFFVMPFVYDAQSLAPDRVVRDVAYREGPGADPEKHRLDLFLPAEPVAPGWPVLVFVHGGGWTRGDRAFTVAGRDVYGNIGRFFASRGIVSTVDLDGFLQDCKRRIASSPGNLIAPHLAVASDNNCRLIPEVFDRIDGVLAETERAAR